MCSGIENVVSTLGADLLTLESNSKFRLRPPGDDIHEAGTCRMGKDPSTSVTNPFGQLHNVPGLYVADNSILPSIAAANPVLTTVALAIRTADYIALQ
ncbi:hypothetical protein GCM10009865_38320 [Aeromicrobium ponti]|uniref:Gluconate 5-dehydrogenase n=2 Tax=Cytobacillus oceanisediminis TaxID=665099 RepID=A0A562JJ10_9BACI|nr:gluconate 5-dehydrogenase [Cytobacillus oceanisediminis]